MKQLKKTKEQEDADFLITVCRIATEAHKNTISLITDLGKIREDIKNLQLASLDSVKFVPEGSKRNVLKILFKDDPKATHADKEKLYNDLTQDLMDLLSKYKVVHLSGDIKLENNQ